MDGRLSFLNESASFRRIDLHWCLTFEPAKANPLALKPKENAADSARILAQLQRTATILEAHLGPDLGLKLLEKERAFQFFSYLFNLESWAADDCLAADEGVDRQIVKSPVSWHSDHLRVGRRFVQMFSLTKPPAASRPCLLVWIAGAQRR